MMMKKIFTLILFISAFLFKPFYSHAQAANVNDSLALVDLYDSTGGPNWINNSGWLKGPVSTWFGISLFNNGKVTSINLNANGLSGNIPAAIGNLNALGVLWLGGNQLKGSIPATLGSLTYLTWLILGGNQLSDTIPSSFSNLIDLAELNLADNQLTGNIPTWFDKLSGLSSLILSNNQFTGTIPSSLGNLAYLKQLELYNNQLSGSIPSELGSLSRLQTLVLYNNRLSGNIPAALGNLTNLQTLELSSNQLSGSIPTWLSTLNNLNGLYLNNNQLTGGIPGALGNLSNLGSLNLSYNQLNDSIPSQLGNLARLSVLYLNNNQLSGNIPSLLGSDTSLQYLNLSHNQLNDSLPASLGNLKYLRELNLNNNKLSGNIPKSLAKLSFTIQFGPTAVFTLDSNYFTFGGMEQIAQNDTFAIYSPQYPILLHFSSNKLSVSAGGTLTNNTYKWYKGDTLIATVSADSTYKPTAAGNYSVAVTNSIATKLTLYSDTIAITNAELPITYLSFTAQPTHSGNLLQWQTATEISSAYFNVQRSTDGVRFVTIDQVNAAGNSSTVQSYQYTDALTGLTPVPPALFYRLQEADKDGDVTYSKIIKLDNNSAPQVTLSIFPNPVHEVLNVQLAGITGTASIVITDASGKTLQTREANAVDGQTISINTQALAAGVYFVQVLHGKQSITQKFVKE